MNNKTKIFAAVLILGSLTACNDDKTNTDKTETVVNPMKTDSMPGMSDPGMMRSMNNMMLKMTGMKMSGNFDIDFATMMIDHHQGAIEMSEEELKSGSDAKMKTMAINIITLQKEEQGRLRDIIKNSKPITTYMEKHEELNQETKAMAEDMKNMQMTKNTDQDFARMMIFHHESAVKMAKAEISHGMNAELKSMAKKMISDQEKEIVEFKGWLAATK